MITYLTYCFIIVISALLIWVTVIVGYWILQFGILMAKAIKAHKDFHNEVELDFTEAGLMCCDQGCPAGTPPRRVQYEDFTPWFACGRCGAGLMFRHDRVAHGRMTWRDALRDQWFGRKDQQ